MELLNEEWRDIKGFEGAYQVSSYGRVKSLTRFIVRSDGVRYLAKGKIIKPVTDRYGYLIKTLTYEGRRRATKIHRLVAEHFIDNPANLTDVNHLDGNKVNNHISNLEWASREGNMHHAWRLGLMERVRKNAGKSSQCKLTSEQLLDIKRRRASGDTLKILAAKYNVSITTIWKYT